MSRSRLCIMLALLATAAGVAALADRAQAQISGTIGGDLVAHDPFHLLADLKLAGPGRCESTG